MRDKLITVCLVLFPLLVDKISASSKLTRCYTEQTIKRVGHQSVQNCTLSVIEFRNWNNDDCFSPRNESYYPLFDPGRNKENFVLSTNTGHDNSDKIVLNVTISNVMFHYLRVELVNVAIRDQIHKQTIEFKRDPIPEQLSLFHRVTPLHKMRIQFFAQGKNNFFKEYYFIPPSDIALVNERELEDNRVFAYVDTTTRDNVCLHVQPLPEYFNITKYIVQFRLNMENRSTEIKDHFNLTNEQLEHKESNFTESGSYDFLLTPVDSNEKNYTSLIVGPFCMEHNDKRLLIMIVSIGVIPVVIFFVLYIAYNILRRKAWKWLKERKLNCLLVYSATHDSHIDVMIKLAEYLKGCELNAMIDVLDIPKETHKNPGLWCDTAFKKADIVLMVSSPQANQAIVVTKTIYRYLDQHAFNLIHEGRRRTPRNKRYMSVLFPYCTKNDLPDEACALDYFELPKDLKKLVNEIYSAKYTEVRNLPNSNELKDIIESATQSIRYGEINSRPRGHAQLGDLVSPKSTEMVIDSDIGREEVVSIDEDSIAFLLKNEKQYETNIRNLDL